MRRRPRGGFTLIELVIVISIVGIMALLAVPNLQKLLPRYRLNKTVRQFCDHVQIARLHAIAEGVEYRICLSKRDGNPTSLDPLSNSGRYTIEKGNHSSGSDDWDPLPEDGEVKDDREGIIDFGWTESNREYGGVSFVKTLPEELGGSGSGNTDCLVFSPRGWLSNATSDFRWGYIQIQFRNKGDNPTEDIRWIQISRGGVARIRMTSRASTTAGDTP